MRRRPAVGVVLCNRMPSPLPHRSSYITLRLSETGPRRTRPYTHTLTFPVTTAYITHTCSTVQHRMHVTHVHVFFSFLSSLHRFTLSIRLSISRASALSLYYIIPSHLFALSFATFLLNALLWLSTLTPGLILLLLFFLFSSSVFCTTAGRTFSFFFLYSCRYWSLDCRRSN